MTALSKAIAAIERDFGAALIWSRRNPLAHTIRRQRINDAFAAYIRAQANM